MTMIQRFRLDHFAWVRLVLFPEVIKTTEAMQKSEKKEDAAISLREVWHTLMDLTMYSLKLRATNTPVLPM